MVNTECEEETQLGGRGRERGTQRGNGRVEEGGEEVNQNNKQLFLCRQ